MRDEDQLTTLEALEAAHRVAMAPFAFQASCVLRETGVLARLGRSRDGERLSDIADAAGLSRYAASILIDAGIGAGLIRAGDESDRFVLTKVGWLVEHDATVRANMDFSREVAYAGLAYLGEALDSGRPAGLRVFGDWPNVYDALASLPAPVRRAWFGFDHHYSDAAFPAALEIVLAHRPRRLLDIGGNTGKWALACLARDPEVAITIFDLPGQLSTAAQHLRDPGVRKRVELVAGDVLDDAQTLPADHDAIWMSQFLDCFSEDQIADILHKCADALSPDGRVYIVEPFVDRQRFSAARFCLQMTSLYFCAIANGCSRIYDSEIFLRLVRDAGFEVEREYDGLGMGHTLLVCRLGRAVEP